MRIFKDLTKLSSFRNPVVTIGTFDGVHIGHQELIKKICAEAKKRNGENIIVTFHPHPRYVLNPDDRSLKLINTLEEKLELLERYGVDNTVVAPFSVDFSQIPAIEYVKDFLVGNFHPSVIVIGYDHRFGRNRSGGIELLKEYAPVFGYEVIEISAEMLEDITVSSTNIRKAIEGGQVELAKQLLGHPFSLRGFVTKGQQIGSQIGFPTANIEVTVDYKIIPRTGVYAARAVHDGNTYPAMMNIGYRPTFEGADKTIEVHIIDFKQDIYGEELKVDFVKLIRPEVKFSSSEALVEQLNLDQKQALKILEED